MNWLWLVSYFFAGVFAANAIPHFVAGSMGRPFQSPFAKPPGKGLSSSTVNVVWGFFNALVGYLLLAHVGVFAFLSGSAAALDAPVSHEDEAMPRFRLEKSPLCNDGELS